MRRQALPLRTIIVIVTTALAALAGVGFAVVAVLATIVHRASDSVRASVESVHLAEGGEVDLLRHERSDDLLVRMNLEGELKRKLAVADQYVRTDSQAEVLRHAKHAVERYVALSRDLESNAENAQLYFELANGSLEALAQLNLEESRAAQRHAAERERLAGLVGGTIVVLLTLFIALFLLWLKLRAFRPLFALAHSMESFAQGAREARAPESGPAEIREIARRFNEMAEALARQRQAQMTFLGGVAHDLRNPLAAIKLTAARLATGGPLPGDEKVRSTLQLVRSQAERIDRMIGDFLDTVKVEAGQLTLRLETRDARELVRDVVELFEATSTLHTLRLELPSSPVFVRCDSMRLGQVLNNLVSNAIKYSPKGGDIQVTLIAEDAHAIMSVRDCGMGISPSEKAHIFEPFRRGHAVTSMPIPGVGLGLFVAKHIVEAHQGQLTVESEPARGSTFSVRLPLSNEAPVIENATWQSQD